MPVELQTADYVDLIFTYNVLKLLVQAHQLQPHLVPLHQLQQHLHPHLQHLLNPAAVVEIVIKLFFLLSFLSKLFRYYVTYAYNNYFMIGTEGDLFGGPPITSTNPPWNHVNHNVQPTPLWGELSRYKD